MRAARWLVPGMFFVSGACGLVYEVVWTRMLVVAFGATVWAASTVLSAFMGGMALGSYMFGRAADRHPDPLRLYAYLELGVGGFALAFPRLLGLVERVYSAWGGGLGTRFVLCFGVLALPTVLMGGTLPSVSKFLVRGLGEVGWGVGRLYALNTGGAVLGCFGTTFFAMGSLGVWETSYLAAVLNILVGAAALALSGGEVPVWRRIHAEGGGRVLPVLVAFGASGFAALGYEVVWTRLLGISLKSNTAYAFGTMLTSFLVGLALGGAAFGRWADRFKDPVAAFGAMELGVGGFGLLSAFLFGALPGLAEALGCGSWWEYSGGRFLAAFVLMLPPTFLLGGVMPVVARMCALGLGGVGRGVGAAYAANTVGAVLGAAGTGFVLMPLFGAGGTVKVLGLCNLTLGACLLAFSGTRAKWGLVGGAVALGALGLSGGYGEVVRRLYESSEPGSKLAFWKDGAAGTVTVHEFPDGKLLMKVNGGGEVPTDLASLQTFKMLGHLPFLLHPDPEEVLVVAFGGGIALGAASLHSARRVECVEMVPEVMEAARLFAKYNCGILSKMARGDVRLVVDDGRNYILRSRRRYDVITGDATHPASSDSWVLYTKEFYDLCREHLKEGGIMVQWLPLHGLSEFDYRMLLRTFLSAFPHTSLWLFNEYTVMVGTMGPLRVDFGRLRARMEEPEVAEDLRSVHLDDPVALVSCLVMGEEDVRAFVGEGPINTDGHPYVSFSEQRRRGTEAGLPNLLALLHARGSPLPYVTDISPEDARRLRAASDALAWRIRGNIFRKGGMPEEAEEAYRRALEVWSEDMDSESFLRELRQGAYISSYAYANAGLAYERAGRYREAIRAYRRSLKADPGNIKVLVNLGNVYARLGMRREAEEAYRKALKVDPGRFEVHFNLGSLYYMEGKFGKAREALERARSIRPDSPAVLYYLGLVYEKEGEISRAIKCYRLASERAEGPLKKAVQMRAAALMGGY